MIFDLTTSWRNYLKDPVFERVFSTLGKNDLFRNEKKIMPINDDIFIKFVSYNTIFEKWITESHRKFVDIQIIMQGSELIKVYDTKDLCCESEYDSSTDCIFYNSFDALKKPSSILTLRPGYMAIFLPHDAHMTQIAIENKPQNINKIVIKAHEKFFT